MNYKLRSTSLVSLLLLVLSCHSIPDIGRNGDKASISRENILATVTYLSSPQLDGRVSGSNGYDTASDFIATQFRRIGLIPINSSINNEGYKQYFNIEFNQIIIPSAFDLVDSGKIITSYKLNQDYLFRGFTGSGDFIAPVTFCGYGISVPEKGYDDYQAVDVNDRVVLMFKEVPRWTNPDVKWQDYNFPRVKTAIAAAHGAVGVLLVSHPNAWLPGIYGSVAHGPGEYIPDVPQLHISESAANDLLRSSGYTVKSLAARIDSAYSPMSFDLKRDVRIIANSSYRPDASTCNVIGILKGSDPDLNNEYIIVGAHLDHVGRQSADIYFPGANDNASGVACMLEIANGLSQRRAELKRSIVFIAFAGEESGLEGSAYFVNHPVIDAQSIVSMLNFDCVGRGDSIRVNGGTSNPELYTNLEQLRSRYKLLSYKSGKGGGADAQAFHDANIPTFYFVTTRGYQHLHKSTDTLETLDADLMSQVSGLATEFIKSLAQYKK
ncbi:M20/M25/M40 family metallo-hydrolase [candidate division KSB1 bacterium]|nr:M20/M25/M40 family metallo-hydrolase [candidate division KSB1 bacterium]